MEEDFESLPAQCGDAPAEKVHVLKCTAAQAYAIQPVGFPEPNADFRDRTRQGVMKLRGNNRRRGCIYHERPAARAIPRFFAMWNRD